MRIKGTRYQELKEGVRAILDHHGLDQLEEHYKKANYSVTSMMWELLNQVLYDFENDDSHPAYAKCGRTRIVPYKGREWNLYADGVNDSHIETALKKIGKELGLIPTGVEGVL